MASGSERVCRSEPPVAPRDGGATGCGLGLAMTAPDTAWAYGVPCFGPPPRPPAPADASGGADAGADTCARRTNPPPRRKHRGQRGIDVDGCPESLKVFLPLVFKLVRQLSRGLPANVERDDLLAAGLFGLIDSIRRNGGSDGETFVGYARMRIRGAIVDELRAQDWLSRRAREAVAATGGEGASFVGLSELTPVEESTHLAQGVDPVEALVARSEHHALALAIAKLPERERRVVGMYYFEGAKLKDIGAELGVSVPRVSQLHARALDRLRGWLSAA